MYVFKLNKSPDSSIEEFESALHCARESVESVLDNDILNIKVVENTIVIDLTHQQQSIDMTISECKEKIKGCFCDASGKLYQEFTQIVVQEK
ncbi:MAG: hypothetical protein RBT65_15410 [Methanolobus sp.]|nr:hypothetical protein [Methanolobus sp.]